MFSRKVVLIAGLIVFFTISILLLTLSSRRPSLAYGPGRLAIAFVAPFQKIIAQTTRFARDTWEHYFALVNVAQENERLSRELRSALAANYQCEEIQLANARLRELLGLHERITPALIAAQVIGKDPSPWFQSMLVDKGNRDGVKKGSPVITSQGIVGLVIEVTSRYSKVMLITDPNSAVDTVVQRSRARGIIKGGTSGYCILNYVLRKHEVATGDTVIASGMDGVFPKGFPVGQVAAVSQSESDIFQDVTVTPFVDFERLEEVLIVPASESTEPS
jgi:rod shape-determining protein MreC